MYYPFLEEFYPKAVVPIGLKDRALLDESEQYPFNLSPCTSHWLIALVGELAPNSYEYFYWRVNIYPTDCEGSFSWNEAVYSSEAFISFDWAIELARTFETKSKNDQLLSTNFQVKIS